MYNEKTIVRWLEEQLKEIWKDTSTKAQINFDLARLMIDLQHKTDRIEGNIRARGPERNYCFSYWNSDF